MNAPSWGVYGYQSAGGELREVLLRSFTTRAMAEKWAEPLSTTIVSAEVRELPANPAHIPPAPERAETRGGL